MVSLKNKTNQNGFTLIELLAAIFIFSIVIVSVYGTYRVTFHIINNSTSELEKANNARIAINRISQDLYGIVSDGDAILTGTKGELHGQRVDSIFFVTANHLKISRDDRSQGRSTVSFSPEYDEESETFKLYRTDTLTYPGQELNDTVSTKRLLCKNIRSLIFTYVNHEGTSEDEWSSNEGDLPVESESGKINLPIMIYIKLEILGQKKEDTNTAVYSTAVSFPFFNEDIE